MNPEQFEKLMQAHREQYKLFKQILISQTEIAAKLEILTSNQQIKDPDYQKPLPEYRDFDWESIGAKAISHDSDGVSAVEWRGRIYKRRSPENKFAPAIWFSRHDGEQYQKLITFKAIEPAEPISRKVLAQISQN